MPAAPLPGNERERVAALLSLDILDTPPEEIFDGFVRVACELFDAPIAAISLVADDRQWFKAIRGLPGVTETPREQSFCAHALLTPGDVLLVTDATRDMRFADNPLVTGAPGLRFYAGAPLLDASGLPIGALCVLDQVPRHASPDALERLRDLASGVSAALRLHGTLRRLDAQARRDPLTGLGNRRALGETLAAKAGAGGASLLMLDLDHFKTVNDTFGHPNGDAALLEVARRLKGTARHRDDVFRLGGDEFALLITEPLDNAALETVAARIHAALADTFTLDRQPIPLRTSIGAAALRGPSMPGDLLVATADAALYEAKRAGRGATRIRQALVEPDAPRQEPLTERRDLATRLRRALLPPGNEPFTLVFQPMVDLGTGSVTSLEALIRWHLGTDGPVSPDEFVPLAERTGLAPHLDRWVLRTACASAVRWASPWAVAVNLSAVTFSLVDVTEMVAAILSDTGLPPSRLILEMTETSLTGDSERTGREMAGLRALGVGIGLDDFGAGHASLLALRRYPFTKIKIDRGLVAGVDSDPVAARTIGFMGELGELLRIKIVAEGVETPAELSEIRRQGVDFAQGYLLSRPVPADAVTEAVRATEAALARISAAPPPGLLREGDAEATPREVEVRRAG